MNCYDRKICSFHIHNIEYLSAHYDEPIGSTAQIARVFDV